MKYALFRTLTKQRPTGSGMLLGPGSLTSPSFGFSCSQNFQLIFSLLSKAAATKPIRHLSGEQVLFILFGTVFVPNHHGKPYNHQHQI
jgi:hypothetical protein